MMKIINLIGCVIFSILVGSHAGFILKEGGFDILSLVVPFLIGFFMPKVIFEWLYKEEIQEWKSRQNEEQ